MAEATTAQQRIALTARVRDDVANLVEELGALQKLWTYGFVFDFYLEVAFFVGFAHHLTAIMTVGHDRDLLNEVLGSSHSYTKRSVAHLSKLTGAGWLQQRLATRMCSVRREQYIKALRADQSFVDSDEIVNSFVSRILAVELGSGLIDRARR